MEIIKTVATVLGILLGMLGLIGGLLSLPDKWKEFRVKLRPLGDRGTHHLVLSRKDNAGISEVTFLVEGDIFHFISAYVKPGFDSEVISLEKIGEYNKVTLRFPTAILSNLRKVKKEK